jgi:nucleotide-binding universal stress UspA family protein
MRTDTSSTGVTIPRDASTAAHDAMTTSRGARSPVESGAKPISLPFELQGRTVLLAMDGSAGASAGARVALALADAHGAIVHVLRVIDSRSVPFPPAMDVALAVGDPDRDLTSHMKEAQEMRGSIAAITGRDVDWPVRVAIGSPAVTIVDEARRIDAALVIVGLHRYGRVDRALNNETSLNVMRRCDCPVLGVVPGTTSLPARILAATDFSSVSLAACRIATAIADDKALLVLAYVSPIAAFLGDEGERMIHDLGVSAAFAQATRELGNEGVTFDHIVLQHDLPTSTAATILQFAEKTNCDLVAAGSTRPGRIARWMTGSVSTELVRDGSRSVLIVPPAGADGRA